MNNEFAPYKESFDMKELGFDEECFGHYSKELGLIIMVTLSNSVFYKDEGVLAPLYQQAFRWFREEHDLSHSIVEHEDKYSYSTNCGNFKIVGTYEEAELACLRKLIEIVKENKDVDKNS